MSNKNPWIKTTKENVPEGEVPVLGAYKDGCIVVYFYLDLEEECEAWYQDTDSHGNPDLEVDPPLYWKRMDTEPAPCFNKRTRESYREARKIDR